MLFFASLHKMYQNPFAYDNALRQYRTRYILLTYIPKYVLISKLEKKYRGIEKNIKTTESKH